MALKSLMDQALVVRIKRVGNIVVHRPKMTPLRLHLPLLLMAIKMMSLSKNKSVLKKKNKILSNSAIKIMITIPLRILPGAITREIVSQTTQKPQLTKLITRRRSSSSHLKEQNHSRQIRDLKS